MRAMIQVTETERTWDAAYASLASLREQDGFVAGRLTGGAGRWQVQGLFEPPLAYVPSGEAAWLPDGMRWVWCPDSFLRSLGVC